MIAKKVFNLMLAFVALTYATKSEQNFDHNEQAILESLGQELSTLTEEDGHKLFKEMNASLGKSPIDIATFNHFLHGITDKRTSMNASENLHAYTRWLDKNKSDTPMSWPEFSQGRNFSEVVEDPERIAVILNCEDYIDLNQLEGFPSNVCSDIKYRYSQANDQEKQVIDYMFGIMETPEQILHFFSGAHIEIHGNETKLYEQWRVDFENNQALKPRISSHVSTSSQYSVGGDFLKEVLFGTRADNGNNYTWMQLEGAPVGGLKEFKENFFLEMMNFFEHMAHFIDYRINGKNIGPYGKSQYTEASPMRIDVSEISAQQQRINRELWKTTFLEHPGVVTRELYERAHEINSKRSSNYKI